MNDTEEIIQLDHFLNVGDRVVLTDHGYKKMSYVDVIKKSTTYRVVGTMSKDIFRIRLITK